MQCLDSDKKIVTETMKPWDDKITKRRRKTWSIRTGSALSFNSIKDDWFLGYKFSARERAFVFLWLDWQPLDRLTTAISTSFISVKILSSTAIEVLENCLYVVLLVFYYWKSFPSAVAVYRNILKSETGCGNRKLKTETVDVCDY